MRGFELAAALMVSPRCGGHSVGHHLGTAFLWRGCSVGVNHPGIALVSSCPMFMFNPLPPHVHAQPPSTHCVWASYPPPFALEGAGEAASSWCEGRKKMYTCCFGAGLFSYISSHGKTRRQEVPFSSLRQPGGGQEGSSPCLWAPGLALDNT